MISQEKLQKRQQVYQYFQKVAFDENNKNSSNKQPFEDFLDKDDKGRRLLIVMEKSVGDVFMVSSLLPSIKETYPDHNIYFATSPSNFDLLDGNPFIHKLLPFHPIMENLVVMEGMGDHEGYFDICFLPFIGTQKILNYVHNGNGKSALELKNF